MASMCNLDLLIDKTLTTNNDTLKNNNPWYIILHSTEKNSSFESLYNLHVNKYHWKGVGYHVFISKGEAYKAREYDVEGAHCLGLNFNSISLCIYSNKGNPRTDDLDIAKEIINTVRSQYGPLPLMSHTLAQIRYINKLSKQKGLITGVGDSNELMSNQEFLNVREKLLNFSEINSMHKHPYLESVIKNFKSCPGEGFYNFITEINKPK